MFWKTQIQLILSNFWTELKFMKMQNSQYKYDARSYCSTVWDIDFSKYKNFTCDIL